MLHRSLFLILIILSPIFLSSCVLSRTTTTLRTAIEQALLAEAAEKTIGDFMGDLSSYENAYIETSEVQAADDQYLFSRLRLRLGQLGLNNVTTREAADLIVYPRVATAGIDEYSFLLGIPSLPITIPAAGTIETPELALFKRQSQTARNRMAVYGLDAETGALAFDMGPQAGSSYFTRYTILFLISFRKTDLPSPYRKTEE